MPRVFFLTLGLIALVAPALAQSPMESSSGMSMDMPMSTPLTSSSAILASSEASAAPGSSQASSEPASAAPANIYANTQVGDLSPAVANALPRVYVPNRVSGTVSVIDPATLKVVGRFRVGFSPQHVVPSWDLQTLYVTADGNGYPHRGTLTPIDPKTGRPGRRIKVDDPYNMYFMPDGSAAIVVAEEYARLDFRDPHSFALLYSISVPGCRGINHADFSADDSYAIFTCEFGGSLAKIDLKSRSVVGYLPLSDGGMPQDIRLSPDGKTFYVADMQADGVFTVDGDKFVKTGFIPTGIGAHGFVVSRDGTKLYVSNRGTHAMEGDGHGGPGSVSTIDFKTGEVIATWWIPGGGSPDMGNVSADGSQLWYSGRFDNVVYCFDTATGHVQQIRVGTEPHGLAVWPQPGRYSLGHTGNMR